MFIIVLFAFFARLPYDHLEYDCVIQSDKVVLNNYKKDELYISIAIEGNKVTQWRRGQSKAYVQGVSNIKRDYIPYLDDKIRLRLFSLDSDFYFDGVVSKSCYDAF